MAKSNAKTVVNTETTTNKFVVKDPKAKASYPMVRMLASYFSKAKGCPKDIKWGTVHGHYVQRLNCTTNPLLQGEVDTLKGLKGLPLTTLKAIRSYKKLVS